MLEALLQDSLPALRLVLKTEDKASKNKTLLLCTEVTWVCYCDRNASQNTKPGGMQGKQLAYIDTLVGGGECHQQLASPGLPIITPRITIANRHPLNMTMQRISTHFYRGMQTRAKQY